MTELKPCPFCGGEAAVWRSERTLKHQIVCTGCLASTGQFESIDDAAEAWNRRAERTCRKVPGRMKYGRRMPACSECGQSLGDARWAYCLRCGARIERGDEA